MHQTRTETARTHIYRSSNEAYKLAARPGNARHLFPQIKKNPSNPNDTFSNITTLNAVSEPGNSASSKIFNLQKNIPSRVSDIIQAIRHLSDAKTVGVRGGDAISIRALHWRASYVATVKVYIYGDYVRMERDNRDVI